MVEYRSESQKLFEGLEKNLREEVIKILLSLTKREAIEEDVTDGQEYESELTKMAESTTEKGVNEVSAGEKNMDDEFKDNHKTNHSKNNHPNNKRNQARKSKKKERQNKKKGKQR